MSGSADDRELFAAIAESERSVVRLEGDRTVEFRVSGGDKKAMEQTLIAYDCLKQDADGVD